ncbi:hypothetical protein [Halorubrum halophilum]|uniref:hypothetical protein n=1 Tax=Halorubrum halophilum TaxID=413816 RepID=UPI00186B388C|nr:hypothetical protein [Halorubrum halophilum]
MFGDRNTSEIWSLALALMIAVSAVGVAFTSGVAAQSDSDVLVDESFAPTNSTQSAYVDITGATDMNGSGPMAVDVTYEGLAPGESAGNGTVLMSETVNVAAGNVSASEYSLAESDTDYDEIVVSATVQNSGDGSLIASTDWGTLEQVSGGGGGALGGAGGLSLPVIAVLVVGGGYYLTRED